MVDLDRVRVFCSFEREQSRYLFNGNIRYFFFFVGGGGKSKERLSIKK